MAPPLLLDNEFLKALERVSLLSRKNLSGTVGAEHTSRTYGSGIEFADYRSYSSGDDARALDWNAYLRLGKLFLKLHQTEQRVPVRILLDCSQSMDCEEGAGSKFLYAKKIAAALAYLALLHLDSVAVSPFADHLQKPMIVSGSRDRFWSLLQFMAGLSCAGKTDLFAIATEFLNSSSSRGMAVVISDFFDDQGCERAVKMLSSAGHDLVLVQVHSAEEQKPSAEGELILEDVETGTLRVVECSPTNTALYEARFTEFCEGLRLLALRNGGRYARATTSVAYQDFVLRTLRASQVVS
jgi:uncharacterized protein (DUF58 family)